MNGIRFGSHSKIKDFLCSLSGSDKLSYCKNVLASGLAGIFGSVVASPLYLIKVYFCSINYFENNGLNLYQKLVQMNLLFPGSSSIFYNQGRFGSRTST